MRLLDILKSKRAIGLLSCLLPAFLSIAASSSQQDHRVFRLTAAGEVIEVSDSTDNVTELNVRESIFPRSSRPLEYSHFSWGADIGASIDMTAHNQSTFDADVVFGYKNRWLQLVGVGGGIHRAFGSGDNYLPVYVVFRSSFSSHPQPLFFSFKAGYSFNTIGNAANLGDTSASIGMGINLALSRSFRSHIIVGYGFRHYSDRHRERFQLTTSNVSLAQLSIGISF